MKYCTCCKILKNKSEFGVQRSYFDGLKQRCKICTNAFERKQRSLGLRKTYAYKPRTRKRSPEQIKKQADKIKFGGLRLPVLTRDGFKCLMCGMTQEEHMALWNRSITINHIDGNGRNSKKPNNTMENLETLCLRCHSRKDNYRTRESLIRKTAVFKEDGELVGEFTSRVEVAKFLKVNPSYISMAIRLKKPYKGYIITGCPET